MRHNLKPAHANWPEVFSFTIVNDLPKGSKTPHNVPSAIMDARAACRASTATAPLAGTLPCPQ